MTTLKMDMIPYFIRNTSGILYKKKKQKKQINLTDNMNLFKTFSIWIIIISINIIQRKNYYRLNRSASHNAFIKIKC